MFYKHTMSLWNKGKKYLDKIKQVHYKEQELVTNFKCDIQPLTQEKALEIYGITQACSHVVYMDLVPFLIVNEQVLKRNDKTYEMVKVVEWEEEEDPDFNYKEVVINEIH